MKCLRDFLNLLDLYPLEAYGVETFDVSEDDGETGCHQGLNLNLQVDIQLEWLRLL